MNAHLAHRQPSVAAAAQQRWLQRMLDWLRIIAQRVRVLPAAGGVALATDGRELASAQYHEAGFSAEEPDSARTSGRSAIVFRREGRDDGNERPSVSPLQSADDAQSGSDPEQFTPVDRDEFYSHLPGGVMSSTERPLSPAQATTGSSVVAADAVWTGTLVTGGSVQVLGIVNGDRIEAQRLEVARGASVNAAVIAGSCSISGSVEGTIECRDRLEITAGGTVQGSISAGTLVVEEGAVIVGNLRMRDTLVLPEDATTVVDGSAET